MTMRSEEIRLRYLYRRLIIDGKAKISFEAAMRLVGPDCAYHLYSSIAKTNLGGIPRASKSHRKKRLSRRLSCQKNCTSCTQPAHVVHPER